jgi:hypothetical protein
LTVSGFAFEKKNMRGLLKSTGNGKKELRHTLANIFGVIRVTKVYTYEESFAKAKL